VRAIHAGPQQAPVHFAQPGVVELREQQHRHRGRKGSSRALAPRARPKPAQPGRHSPSPEIRDPRSGAVVASLRTAAWGRSVAFSPDGSLVATGDWDGRAQLWSTETWKPAGRPLEGHAKRILTLDFSRDGRTLASASEDGTVVLWDVDTRTAVGSPLIVDAHTWTSAAFTAGGSHLFAISDRGRGMARRRPPRGLEATCLSRRGTRVHGARIRPRAWRPVLSRRLPARIARLPLREQHGLRHLPAPSTRRRSDLARDAPSVRWPARDALACKRAHRWSRPRRPRRELGSAVAETGATVARFCATVLLRVWTSSA
jgi:hypothetical protein